MVRQMVEKDSQGAVFLNRFVISLQLDSFVLNIDCEHKKL